MQSNSLAPLQLSQQKIVDDIFKNINSTTTDTSTVTLLKRFHLRHPWLVQGTVAKMAKFLHYMFFFQKGGKKYPRYKQNVIKEVERDPSVFVILYAQNTLEIKGSTTPCGTESFLLITYLTQNRTKQIKNNPQKPLFSFSTQENSLLKDCFHYKNTIQFAEKMILDHATSPPTT